MDVYGHAHATAALPSGGESPVYPLVAGWLVGCTWWRKDPSMISKSGGPSASYLPQLFHFVLSLQEENTKP